MKRQLLTLGLLISSAFVMNAQTSISFEESENFSVGSINAQNEWAVSMLTNGSFVDGQEVVNDEASAGTQSLKLSVYESLPPQPNPSLGAFRSFSTPINISGENNRISLDFRVDELGTETSSDFAFYFENIISQTSSQLLGYIHLSNDGTLLAINGTNAQGQLTIGVIPNFTFSENSWYNLTMVFNSENIQYYVNESLIHTGIKISDATQINSIAFAHDNFGSSAYIDNIQLGVTSASVENFEKSGLAVYPNPATDVLNISSENNTIDNVAIVDMNGRVVKSVGSVNALNTVVSISELSSGMYILNVTSNGVVSSKKIVKK